MYNLNDKVYLSYTHDEFDRLIEDHAVFAITRINTTEVVPHRGWDYEITSDESGNVFFVTSGEILPVENDVTDCSTIFNSDDEEFAILAREYEIEQMWVRSGVQL